MPGYRPAPVRDTAGDELPFDAYATPPGWTWQAWRTHIKPDDVETVLRRWTPGDCRVALDERPNFAYSIVK